MNSINQNDSGAGVLVFAFNGNVYLHQAISLAISVKKNSPDTQIGLVTNLSVPDWAVALFKHIKSVDITGYNGIEYRYHFDKFCIFQSGNLILDSDTLVYKSLNPVFKSLEDVECTIFEHEEPAHGHWFVEPGHAKMLYNEKPFHGLSGDAHYIKPGHETDRTFGVIRTFADQYDSLGIARWRGGLNDEPVFALAYRQLNKSGVFRDPLVLGSAVFGKCAAFSSDVMQGKAWVKMRKGAEGNPATLHFENYAKTWVYIREVCSLVAWYRGNNSKLRGFVFYVRELFVFMPQQIARLRAKFQRFFQK